MALACDVNTPGDSVWESRQRAAHRLAKGFILATQTLWKLPLSVSIAVDLQYLRRPSVMKLNPQQESRVIGVSHRSVCIRSRRCLEGPSLEADVAFVTPQGLPLSDSVAQAEHEGYGVRQYCSFSLRGGPGPTHGSLVPLAHCAGSNVTIFCVVHGDVWKTVP